MGFGSENGLAVDSPFAATQRSAACAYAVAVRTVAQFVAAGVEKPPGVVLEKIGESRIRRWTRHRMATNVLVDVGHLLVVEGDELGPVGIEAGEVKVPQRSAVDHEPASYLVQLALVEVPKGDIERAVANDRRLEVDRCEVEPQLVDKHPGCRLLETVARQSLRPPRDEVTASGTCG